MKLKKILLVSASVLSLGSVAVNSVSPIVAHASEDKVEQSERESQPDLSESVLLLELPENTSYTIDDNHGATLKNEQTGEIEQLPSEAKDKHGVPVNLIYLEEDNELYVLAESKYQTRSVGKCLAGIGGGAVTGGGGLGLKFAGAGTVVVPGVGTVAAGTVGAVAGAVGGGLTGAAKFCFD